jgi:uncharacterized protein (DUF488 family)
MRLYTIGFTGKSAEAFFGRLQKAGVEKLVDVRRSNNTLFCGFTRMRDLPFFLNRLCGIDYVHEPEFAPSLELLREYQRWMKEKKKPGEIWPDYVRRFDKEIADRPIAKLFRRHASGMTKLCLLCAEAKPEYCHRRLLAEHIAEKDGSQIEIVHL